MKYSDYTLQTWTAKLSETEERRAENAINMIKDAIRSDEKLKKYDIEIFLQGSYANNTNVKSESDVDVCIMLKDIFHCDYPTGKTDKDYGFSTATLTFKEFKSDVIKSIIRKFGTNSVSIGDKSIKISENSYHVKADVVPTIQLRNYYYGNSSNPSNYVEGTYFYSSTGKGISNYPKIHKKNGIDKNEKTNHEYKKLVRIMKHIKNNMVDDGKADGKKITSFLIESLIWNVPNEIITSYDSWNETVKNALLYIHKSISENTHSKWTEVSGMLYLFDESRAWSDRDVKTWLETTWNYLGYVED